MTTSTLLPFQPDAMSPAQLAAVSYLARYSGHTHALYAYQLRRWFSWCQTNGLDPLVGIQRAHVELYIRHLGESGLRVSSVNTMMHGVRGFFRFAHIDGLTTADPAVYARLPKIHSDESRTQGLDRLELIRFLRWSKVTDTPLLVLALPFVVVLVVPLLADLSPAQQFPDRRAARVAQPDAQTPPVRTPRSWPSWLRRTTQAATETMSTKEAGAFFLTQVCRTNRAPRVWVSSHPLGKNRTLSQFTSLSRGSSWIQYTTTSKPGPHRNTSRPCSRSFPEAVRMRSSPSPPDM